MARPTVTGSTAQRTTTTPGKPPKYRSPRRKKLAQFLMAQSGDVKMTRPANTVGPGQGVQVAPVDPLDAQVDAQAKLRYGGATAELERTARAIPEWFKAYQDRVTAATEANRAAQQQAMGQLAGLQTALTNLGTGQAQALGVSEAGSAAVRGAPTDTSMAPRAVDAGGVRRDLLAGFQALTSQQGLTQEARDQEQGRYAAGRQISELQRNAEKRQDLASERGAFKEEARRKLLEDLRKQALEEAVFKTELDESKAKTEAEGAEVNQWGYSNAQWQQMTPEQRLQAQRAQKQATTLPKPKAPETVNAHGYTASEWRKMSTEQRRKIIAADKKSGAKPPKPEAPRTGPGSKTPAKEAEIKSKIDKIVGQLQKGSRGYNRKATNTIVTPGGETIQNTPSAIIRSLMDGGVSREMAHVIVSLYRNNGKLGPDGVKNAHKLGLHVGGVYELVGRGRK